MATHSDGTLEYWHATSRQLLFQKKVSFSQFSTMKCCKLARLAHWQSLRLRGIAGQSFIKYRRRASIVWCRIGRRSRIVRRSSRDRSCCKIGSRISSSRVSSCSIGNRISSCRISLGRLGSGCLINCWIIGISWRFVGVGSCLSRRKWCWARIGRLKIEPKTVIKWKVAYGVSRNICDSQKVAKWIRKWRIC